MIILEVCIIVICLYPQVVDEQDLRERIQQLVAELKGESDAGNNAWIYQYDAGLKAEAPIIAETYVVCFEIWRILGCSPSVNPYPFPWRT